MLIGSLIHDLARLPRDYRQLRRTTMYFYQKSAYDTSHLFDRPDEMRAEQLGVKPVHQSSSCLYLTDGEKVSSIDLSLNEVKVL